MRKIILLLKQTFKRMTENLIPTGRVIMPFNKLRDAVLAGKGQEIYSSMLDNPNFEMPTPDMPTLLSVLGNYSTSLTAAQTRERTAVIVKNQNRIILIAALKQLGSYINFTAQGDLSMLSTSGYDIAKTRSKSPPITKPLAPSLIDGPNSGELISSVDAVKGAKSYVHQYRIHLETGDTEWVSVFSSSRRCVLQGLIPSQRYSVRVGALGPNDQVMYSDTVSRIVQ